MVQVRYGTCTAVSRVPKGFLAEGKAAPPKQILPPRGRDNGALRARAARTDWLSTFGMPIHGPREPQGVKGAERHVPQEKASGIKRPQRLQQGPPLRVRVARAKRSNLNPLPRL